MFGQCVYRNIEICSYLRDPDMLQAKKTSNGMDDDISDNVSVMD